MKRLHILTIVYNGMPTITWHLPVFNRLSGIDWTWHVVEGPALNVGCTQWCKRLQPGKSTDGTSEYLDEIEHHKRVRRYSKSIWNGKIEMVNAPMHIVEKGDIVMEVDCDEIWTSRQIDTAFRMLHCDETKNAMLFTCRYFVGKDIVITTKNKYGNRRKYEWRRMWKAEDDSFRFTRHEPPETRQRPRFIEHKATENLGLVFDHYAYAFESQVAFKERYYGYANAVAQWRSLQENDDWPADISRYMKWVDEGTIAERL